MSGAEAPIDNDGDEKKPEIAQNDAGAEPGHGGDLEPESPQAGGAIANDEVTVNVERVVVSCMFSHIRRSEFIATPVAGFKSGTPIHAAGEIFNSKYSSREHHWQGRGQHHRYSKPVTS